MIITMCQGKSSRERKLNIRKEIYWRLKEGTLGAAVTVERVLFLLKLTCGNAFEAGKYSAAVRCVELQGKYLGMFSNCIEHSEAIEDISTEKLVELIRELAEAGDIDLFGLLAQGESTEQ